MRQLFFTMSLLGSCSLFLRPSSESFQENHNQNCNDGADNDGDGLIDGSDDECVALCGDGVIGAGEGCDDANLSEGDGCSGVCQVEPGFQCGVEAPSQCATLCGDGLVLGPEQCDDGNNTSGDGCSSTCSAEVLPQCPDALDADRALFGPDGRCYAAFDVEVSYDAAKRLCETRGGHLATITSQEEAALLGQLAPLQRAFWLGAVQDRGAADTFFWTTYEPVTLDLFTPAAGADEACVALFNNTWPDIDCLNAASSALCEFEAPIVIPGAKTNADSFSIIALDYDNNGAPDVAAAALGVGVLSVLENDGFGSLSRLQNFQLGGGTNSEIASDVDDNGKQDLIVSNFFTFQTSLLRNIGNSTFVAEPLFLTQKNQTDLIFGDFNGDNLLDIALSTIKTSDGTNDGFIEIFLRTPNGAVFSGGGIFSTLGVESLELVTSDFTGDGKPDIAVVNHGTNNISILVGDGAGAFATQTTLDTCGSPFSLDLGDANQDGLPDLVTACEGGGVEVFFLEDPGTLTFSSVLLDIQGTPEVARFGDINNDSTLDVVVSQIGSQTLSVAFNQAGFFDPTLFRTYTLNGAPGELVIEDFNQDGFNDVAVANSSGQSIDMLLNQGNGILLAPQ